MSLLWLCSVSGVSSMSGCSSAEMLMVAPHSAVVPTAHSTPEHLGRGVLEDQRDQVLSRKLGSFVEEVSGVESAVAKKWPQGTMRCLPAC